MKERAALAAKSDKFWYTAIMNCGQSAQFVDPVDHEALQHLDDVWIEHDADPRNWTITFTFNKKNPYFDETKLVKHFTVVAPKGIEAEPATAFDLEADLFIAGEQKIRWTSSEHDLVKKAPKVSHAHAHGGGCCGGHGTDDGAAQVNIQELEENDEFSGPGSFFNLFAQTGEDEEGLGEFLLEWWAHALEYAAGLQPEEDSDEDYDFDDEDSDLEGSVDLESEEEQEKPAKKKAKK